MRTFQVSCIFMVVTVLAVSAQPDLVLNPDDLNIPADCMLPPLIGPCRAAFPRFYYNSFTQNCEPFIYGGCRANGNNFETVEECKATCMKD